MFTFNHAFFPPSAPSDILTAFAGPALRGQGTQRAHRVCAQREAPACPLDVDAIATRPELFMPLRPILIWKGSGPHFQAIWCRSSRGSRVYGGKAGNACLTLDSNYYPKWLRGGFLLGVTESQSGMFFLLHFSPGLGARGP